MADVALAAVVNLPALAEQLLAAAGSEQGGSAAQAAKPALLSAAAALASAASALAGSGKEQAAGAAAALAKEAGAAAAAAGAADVPSAADVQALLEEEINAMNRLLDGRCAAGAWAVDCCCCNIRAGWLLGQQSKGHCMPRLWRHLGPLHMLCPPNAACLLPPTSLQCTVGAPGASLPREPAACHRAAAPGKRQQRQAVAVQNLLVVQAPYHSIPHCIESLFRVGVIFWCAIQSD